MTYRSGVVIPALRCRPPWQRLTALAAVIGVVQVIGTHFAARHQTHARPLDAGAYLLLVAAAALLLGLRRSPPAVLVAVFAVTSGYLLLHYPLGPVFFSLIAAFIATVVTGHRALAVVVLCLGYVTALWIRSAVIGESPPGPPAIVGLAAWLLVLLSVGEGVRI